MNNLSYKEIRRLAYAASFQFSYDIQVLGGFYKLLQYRENTDAIKYAQVKRGKTLRR